MPEFTWLDAEWRGVRTACLGASVLSHAWQILLDGDRITLCGSGVIAFGRGQLHNVFALALAPPPAGAAERAPAIGRMLAT